MQNIFAHKGEGSLLLEHQISLAQTLQEGPFQVMFVGTRQQKEQKNLNTRKRKSNNYENDVCLGRFMHPIS